jgi:hypothetical protein
MTYALAVTEVSHKSDQARCRFAGGSLPSAGLAPGAAGAAAVAAHVGKPTDAVAASWSGATEAGTAMVTVSDAEAGGAERVHTCEVDAAGRVRAIRHPGA